MVSFSKGFEIPKFNKYRDMGNPEDHIREFQVHCMEVAHDETYLMRLFPRSLAGNAIDWFSRLSGIKKFQEIVDAFIHNYSFNTPMEVSLQELSSLKQGKNESFGAFLQRWRSKANQSKWSMPEEQQVGTIIANLDGPLAFHLKMQNITTYDQLIPRALNIEQALATQGETSSYQEGRSSSNYHDKP